MSPPAICCGTTPSFCSTRPPKPATRILMPLKSAGVFSSLRNQPKLCPPVLPHGMLTTPSPSYISSISFLPSPNMYQALCWRAVRPNGSEPSKISAGLLPM